MRPTEPGKIDRLVIALIVTADAVLAIDFATAVAIPMIGDVFHTSPGVVQWTITGYSLAFGSFALLGGRLSDVIGDGRCYILGCLLSAAAMILSAASPTMEFLICARGLAGIAAAFLLPATLSLLANYFVPGPAQLRVLSIHIGASAIASPLGGLLIGWTIERVGWWTAFLTMLPFILSAALIAWRFLPRRSRSDREPGPLNLGIALVFVVLIAGLSWSLSRVLSRQVTSIWLIAVAACVAFLAAAVVMNRKSAYPMVPSQFFTSKTYALSIALSGMMTVAVTNNVVLVHLTLQRTAGLSPFESALMFVPSGAFALFLGVLVAPPLTKYILRHPQTTMVLCFTGVALADLMMALDFAPAHAAALFLTAMLLANAGMVFGSSAVMSEIYRSAPPGTEGVTSSLILTCRMLFIASGTSAVVNVASAGNWGHSFPLAMNRFGAGFLLTTALACAAVVAVLILRPRPHHVQ